MENVAIAHDCDNCITLQGWGMVFLPSSWKQKIRPTFFALSTQYRILNTVLAMRQDIRCDFSKPIWFSNTFPKVRIKEHQMLLDEERKSHAMLLFC